jgi:prephenate dehydrogenase
MIGIIGYGRFGELAAKYLAADTDVYVYSSRKELPGVDGLRIHLSSIEEVCRQKIVIPAVPISAFRNTLKHIAPLLNSDALVVDVCSVKEKPVQWMQELLPGSVSILATHPMFGPDSAADSLEGMKIALCNVRVDQSDYEKIITYLETKGLIVIDTTAEIHDRQIAVSLALTHFIGRSLSKFGAEDLEIDTEGYKRLLHILDVVEHDTWQLFGDMHRFNPYAKETRAAFMEAIAQINSDLESLDSSPDN